MRISIIYCVLSDDWSLYYLQEVTMPVKDYFSGIN